MVPTSTLAVTDTIKRRALPQGGDGLLWSTRGDCGVFEFRGSRVRVEVHGTDDVLFPTDCGLSLLAALRDDPRTEIRGRRALDIGCGSGIYSVALLAAGAAHVTALDVNVHAADVTRTNALINQLDPAKLSCVTEDLARFRPGATFDLIIANPPHLPYHPAYAAENGLELALIGGDDGRSLYDAVIDSVEELLAPGGTLIFTHSSLANIDLTKRRMAGLGYRCRTIEVFDMDIPLRAYADHAETLMRELEALRREGKAVFEGNRFSVHILSFRREHTVPAP
jgi:release factor glutamine methyltransferase